MDLSRNFNNRENFTFSEFVNCCKYEIIIFIHLAFYSTFIKDIISRMNSELVNSIYAVIVCYMISMIFNTLSAIFGLMSNMINSSYLKKTKIE